MKGKLKEKEQYFQSLNAKSSENEAQVSVLEAERDSLSKKFENAKVCKFKEGAV